MYIAHMVRLIVKVLRSAILANEMSLSKTWA